MKDRAITKDRPTRARGGGRSLRGSSFGGRELITQKRISKRRLVQGRKKKRLLRRAAKEKSLALQERRRRRDLEGRIQKITP